MTVCTVLMMEENTENFRHATPYHAPVYLAQKMGYFADEGIKVALLEPNDPSGTQLAIYRRNIIIIIYTTDVTEIIGSGKVDMGFKAMIHTLAVGNCSSENLTISK